MISNRHRNAWSAQSKCYFSPDIGSIIIEGGQLPRIAGSIVECTDVSAFFAAEWRAEVGKFMSGIRLHARASVWSFQTDKEETRKEAVC